MAKKADASAIQKVLELISSGKSVRESCKKVGIDECSFRRNVDATQYARARESCADRQFEEMEDLERQCLEEDLRPDIFKAVMDSRKWRLARMRPKVYGDKIDIGSSDGSMSPKPVIDFSGMTPKQISELVERTKESAERLFHK